MNRVIVVGSGVVGLSCAVRLLEAGHRVDVVARDLPLETTSAVAAAIWYPYLALPQDRVSAWASSSYSAFTALAASGVDGVRMMPGSQFLRADAPEGLPWWSGAVPDLVEGVAVVGDYTRTLSFTTPIVEMPLYLAWLAARVVELGGSVTRLNLSALPVGNFAVVNCSGLGARLLGSDPSVTPVQGQVVRVAQIGLERWTQDNTGPTYVVPRTHDIVVGGTSVPGEWGRTPAPEAASDILRRALRMVPELAGAEVLSHKVGLRPARPEVRLERVDDVVHCYGHGGAGVTLSWGCADEVASLLA